MRIEESQNANQRKKKMETKEKRKKEELSYPSSNRRLRRLAIPVSRIPDSLVKENKG
jgi:hypothetical protein